MIAAGVGAALVLAAVLAITGVLFDDGGNEPADSGFGQIETPEPPPLRQPTVERIRVGGTPDSIAVGSGFVWVADSLAGTVKRIAPGGDRPIRQEPAGFPTDVSADESGAWLALPDRGAVQRLTPDTGAEPPVQLKDFPFQVAVGEGAIWAMSEVGVVRVDPSSGRATESFDVAWANSAIAAGEGAVWLAYSAPDAGTTRVAKLELPDGDSFEAKAQVPGAFNVTVGESGVWALGAAGTLFRIDPGTGELSGDAVQIPQALDVAAGLGYVWVTSAAGTVTRFDPASGTQVGQPIKVARELQSIAIGEGSVWVAAAKGGAVYRITP